MEINSEELFRALLVRRGRRAFILLIVDFSLLIYISVCLFEIVHRIGFFDVLLWMIEVHDEKEFAEKKRIQKLFTNELV